MWKKIALVVAALVVVLAVVVATRPAEFSVTRSTHVDAPPRVPYAIVADFHRWAEFSPWEKLDPAMQKSFAGAPAGKGAGYAWKGNDKVGEGKMTIVEAVPDRRVDIRLEFLAPFPATNDATFAFEPDRDGTNVTWTMRGKNNFVAKAFSLFMDMDKLVGGDFERGLAALATASRAAKPAPAPAAAASGTPLPATP